MPTLCRGGLTDLRGSPSHASKTFADRADGGGRARLLSVRGGRADGPRAIGVELGARYWYSVGRNGYDYYADTTSALMVSRLTYDKLAASSGELYFRGDVPWGLFVKGVVRAGRSSGGNLLDEDFPPGIVPYSATTSSAMRRSASAR